MFSVGEMSAHPDGVKVSGIRNGRVMGLIAADERTTRNQRYFFPDGPDRLSVIKPAGDHLPDLRARISAATSPS